MFTIIPAFNLGDPEQVTPDFERAKILASNFVTKYHEDCPRIAIVEIKVLGYVEYSRPIFTPAND